MIRKPRMRRERQPPGQRHPTPVDMIQNSGEQRMPRTHLTRHRNITRTTHTTRLQPIPTTLKRIRRQINNPTTNTTPNTKPVEHRTPINIKPPHPQTTQRTHHTPHL
ncbi:hypothetical protein, partial [Streptomyces sp. HCCB10043]|uniref:hypothetical protein n=1 Tax=Streptomyces sp. HCCB10043 TaxID=1396518 RepID=UPI001F250687